MKNRLLLACCGALVVCNLLPGCSGATRPDSADGPVALTGQFRSVKGVMDPLSCYCFNAGYLTLENGEEIPVCLKTDQEEVACAKIRVEGRFISRVNRPEPSSPCPAEEKRYFQVERMTCHN
ncbi:MAG: hypothetical protein H6562_05055 [Lewinellaceae bacterium]|nr:hypothetical protein [Lewinella sp.]MCB9278259.1 hypothetical protein [Lewinellaceae bacterium]